MIRKAEVNDAEAIMRIWNHYVQETLATFHSELYFVEEIEERISRAHTNDHGFFVVGKENEIVEGFGLYREFRGGTGYRFSMEHTLYVDPLCARSGLGIQLYEALEAHARARGVHSFTGVIAEGNVQSIKFHERLGFKKYGRFPQSGYKWEQWHDAIIMCKIF